MIKVIFGICRISVFSLLEDNTFEGVDVSGDMVYGTWWTDGDSIAIGYETNLITEQFSNQFTVRGVIPLYVDSILVEASYEMTFMENEETSLNEVISSNKISFSCSPNPTNSFLNIDYFLPEKSEVEVHLKDQLGRNILIVNNTKTVGEGFHKEKIDLSGLSKGIYFVSLNSKWGVQTNKIIKN